MGSILALSWQALCFKPAAGSPQLSAIPIKDKIRISRKTNSEFSGVFDINLPESTWRGKAGCLAYITERKAVTKKKALGEVCTYIRIVTYFSGTTTSKSFKVPYCGSKRYGHI
jgi:hypothetical protein